MRSSIHPRLHPRLGIAAVAATGLLLAGCSDAASTTAPSTTPAAAPTGSATASPAASPAALAWTGSVCTALDPLLTTITSPPHPNLGNAAAAKQAYSSYLGTAIEQAGQARKQVAAAGAPPVSDQVGHRVQDQLAQLGSTLSRARAQVDQADPNNALSIAQAADTAGTVLGSLGDTAKTLAGVRSDPQLGPAFAQTPSCGPLRSIGTSS